MNPIVLMYSYFMPYGIVGGEMIFILPQKKPKYWIAKMAGIYLVLYFMNLLLRQIPFPSNIIGTALSDTVIYGTCLLATIPLLKHLFQVPWDVTVFAAIGGYSLQHVSSLLSNYLPDSGISFLGFNGDAIHMIFETLITTLVLFAAWYILGRQMKKERYVKIGSPYLIALFILAIIVEITLSSVAYQQKTVPGSEIYYYSSLATNLLFSISLLVIEFTLLTQKKLEMKLDIIQQLREKEKLQYQFTRETIQQINVKCHDMRHQIRSLNQRQTADPAALKELADQIRIYDSQIKTGSSALDVLLAEKSLYCQAQGIEINCIADGKQLSFLNDSEVYSLFGNLLENAIHAVQSLPADQRLIGLNIRRRGDLLVINSHNYFEGTLEMNDDLPTTSSQDKENHGFGTLSMSLIVEKYEGSIAFRQSGNIFFLDIIIPIPDTQYAVS